jgi:hypothetical protein
LKGGYNNWSKPNDYKNNNILNTKADPFGIQKLFETQTAVAINEDDLINDSIKNASLSELKEKGNLINQTANVKKKQEEYKIYKTLYHKIHGEDDTNFENINDKKSWGNQIYHLTRNTKRC